MSDFEKRLAQDLTQGQEYSEAYSEAFANEFLATQIQMLRKQRGWTQAQLGEKIGSNQGRVSIYEDEDYGKWSLETLRKMAGVFGLWVKVSFESYGTLIQEAAHFEPAKLLRKQFEDDLEVRRWLDPVPSANREDKTLAVVARWADAAQPDRAVLTGWLQGFGLPGFDGRDSTPVQHLLESVPETDDRLWSIIGRELAAAVTADESEISPLIRNPIIYEENLFGLIKAIGPRRELQDALNMAYVRASQRFERDGRSGLTYEGAGGLVEAMIYNQLDNKWKEPIWNRYLSGGSRPDDFARGGHPFLPGRAITGLRGLLGMPAERGYWDEIARGVRDLERRLLVTGHANLASVPNIMDELTKAVGVIFDWWGEPRSAQELMQGSIDLMSSGTWSMYAQAAWAYGVCRRGWAAAVRSGNEAERKTYADILASGLKLYTDWQLARRKQQPEGVPDSAEIEKFEKASHEYSMVVMGHAA